MQHDDTLQGVANYAKGTPTIYKVHGETRPLSAVAQRSFGDQLKGYIEEA